MENKEKYEKNLSNLQRRWAGVAQFNQVDTEDDFRNYLSQQSNEISLKGTNNSVRLYRGQFDASWSCTSSLLRQFKKIYRKEDNATVFREAFYRFCNCNKELWRKMMMPHVCCCDFSDLFKQWCDGSEENKVEMTEFWQKIAQSQSALNYELNAAWREVVAQHYGMPTALIDFTKNLYVALFFATDDLSVKYYPRNDVHDGYCSVIHFDTGNEIQNWEKVRENRINDIRDVLMICENDKPCELVDYSLPVEEWNANDDSSEVDDFSIPVYFEQSNFRPINNDRIEKQEGVLLCLGKNRYLSLEEAFKEAQRVSPSIPQITFTLINRKLLPIIRQVLSEQSIDRETLGIEKYIIRPE